MKKIGLIGLLVVMSTLFAGCSQLGFKPYLPENLRTEDADEAPGAPGLFSGKKGEFVIISR